MRKTKVITYDLIGKRLNDLTPFEYAYFASLSIEKRREIIYSNYLLVYPDTLYANKIIMEREEKKKKRKTKVTL